MSAVSFEELEEKYEITVTGQVAIGAEMSHVSPEPFAEEDRINPLISSQSVLPAYERDSASPPHLDVERRRVGHEFQVSDHEVFLSDQGLVLQYGILGAPGSGKTNLLMHLLHQVMAHSHDDRSTKFGGLIIDPKAALIGDVRRILRHVGRENDLKVVNALNLRNSGINVIDCALSSTDLGEALVLAARSAGIGASEPFWLQQMSKILGAIHALMVVVNPSEKPTLRQLINFAVGTIAGQSKDDLVNRLVKLVPMGSSQGLGKERLETLIRMGRDTLSKGPGSALSEDAVSDGWVHLENLERYASRIPGRSDPKQRQVVEQFIEQAFSIFRLSGNACYSVNGKLPERSLYDSIIEDGKVILVSPGPQELTLSRILPSLMKLIFQRTVLSRFERYRSKELTNKKRPVLFLADEYHTIATQLDDVPFGDSEFFSQARQFGALCLVATQSVEQLQRSGLGDAWKAVFATLAAVIFMRGQDPATRKYLDDIAGLREHRIRKRDQSRGDGKDGLSWSVEMVDAPIIPKGLMEILTQGQAVVVGTTEGNTAPTTIRYAEVPLWTECVIPQRPADVPRRKSGSRRRA
jgi:hypothetical protein